MAYEVVEHFMLMNEEPIWYREMNLLGREDAGDNLMQTRTMKIA